MTKQQLDQQWVPIAVTKYNNRSVVAMKTKLDAVSRINPYLVLV